MSIRANISKLLWPYLARLAVGLSLITAYLIARLVCGPRRRRSCRNAKDLNVLVAGGFFNPNWFRSHILPLATASTVGRVVVICHEPLFPMDRVTYACPPRWLRRLVGGGPSKAFWLVWTAIRHRPDVLIGYHIFNALTCLVSAALVDGKAIYQMTGGPVQMIGGGYGSEPWLLRRLGRPSAALERMMLHVASRFDAIVVRGGKAAAFLRAHRLPCRIAVITGSVDPGRFCPNGSTMKYDVVTVGRLAAVKRFELFLEIVAALVQYRPQTRAAVVGDGPMLSRLEGDARRLGIHDRVDFLGQHDAVEQTLQQSRLFVLTSEKEALSIAMLEAMASGLPVAVPDVGELGEFACSGETGLIIDPTRPRESAEMIAEVLADDGAVDRMACTARQRVESRCSIPAIATHWDDLFAMLTGPTCALPRSL